MKLFAKENKVDKMYLVGDIFDNNFNLQIVTPAGIITFEKEEEVQELLALIGEQLFYVYKSFLFQTREENESEEYK